MPDINLRLPLLALLLLLAGCDQQSAAQLLQKLPGTWTSITRIGSDGGELKSSFIVGPNGAFVSQGIYRINSGEAVQTLMISGTLEVRDGVMTCTITKQGGTNAVPPKTLTARILRLDARALAYETVSSSAGVYQTNEIVLHKELTPQPTFANPNRIPAQNPALRGHLAPPF